MSKTMIMGTADTIRPIYKSLARHKRYRIIAYRADLILPDDPFTNGGDMNTGHEYALVVNGGTLTVLFDGEIDEHAASCGTIHAYGYIGRHKYVRMSGREWW